MTNTAQLFGKPSAAASPAVADPAIQQPVSEAYAEGAFEGPEKLLEVWFLPNADAVHAQCKGTFAEHGLRAVRREVWDAMLDVVRCKVLSVIRTESVDAYLLSESSMFVYPHKLILKTCGTTTLLKALPSMLRIAMRAGLNRVWRLFYSRKSFMFPDRQHYPHNGWQEEVSFLDDLFLEGSAYLVGKTNADHWYLYLTAPQDNYCTLKSIVADASALSELTRIEARRHASDPRLLQPEDDQTVEILMTDLDRDAAQAFYHRLGEKDGHVGGHRVDAETGLDKIDRTAQMDSYLFSPCGYSLNALSGENYFTVHVTPEPGYSYASFETNLPLAGGDRAVSQLVRQVVDIFRPGKFSVTVFKSLEHANTQPAEETVAAKLPAAKDIASQLKGWGLTDRIVYEFDGYHFGFASFEHAR
ncbi:S-adenosylmethionine decarboxylase [Thamnocephalis sphaerospora]|uniref:adenosylmethionine decarboxylase n=1 Tax=Thamnocephalis sphaerospora TaxID=78915 RepID=A0A4P9XGI8_9FUNG|nr:S-adenosylmethionine decarboxylase [Thamnocephalis sphaerospora]|eukprot:RKP04746.1 S-adenosylmethionine decarboxylase [Thamnocephalis sphaerospora]